MADSDTLSFVERIAEYTKGIDHISPGICPGCETCQQQWGLSEAELEAGMGAGSVIDEPHMSGSICETCGDVAGDRHAAHGFVGARLLHLDICPDCLCYFANGDIPTGSNA
jgi:hypothetical protein